MIKSNVTVCGIVARQAVMRTGKEGTPFLSVPINVVIPARSGSDKTIKISIRTDGSEADIANYRIGARIEAKGTLTFKRRGDSLYLNLSASGVNVSPETDGDSVTGEMEFRGKVGKRIDERTDRKGNLYLQFSAHSTEKVGESFESVWVRFIRFNAGREEWLQPGCRVQVRGEMNLSAYDGSLNISCKVAEMAEAVKPEYETND